MKALFILPGPEKWASSRLRATWPAKYLGADVAEANSLAGIPLLDYDATIWVKVADPITMQLLREQGRQVWWDVCDPSWWWSPRDCREIADIVTGMVASSAELAGDFNEWYGRRICKTIPDRLELEHYPRRREHGRADPVRFVWFGAGQNRIALMAALANLERLAANGYNLSLTVYDDHPEAPWDATDRFPVSHVRWALDQENAVIAAHDIALLPPYPGPWGKVKSNNKGLTAWACGLPSTDGQDYGWLEKLAASAETRAVSAEAGYYILVNDYRAEQSAAEWEALLCAS